MKLYEQLCFDLLNEYQTTNPTNPTNPTNSNIKTLAITEILKKANVTDQNVLKAIADILDQDEDKKQTNTNVQQTATTPTGAVIPPATSTPGIKS
jgi:predicted transcriptional regulator